MKPRDLAMLVGLAAMWGASYLFIRVASPVFGPAGLMAARVLIASALLWIVLRARGGRLRLAAMWRADLALGAVNAAVPFLLIAIATLSITASLAAVLNATTPVFSAIASAIWLRKRPGAAVLLGLPVGIAGVAIVVGAGPLPITPALLAGAACSLVAAACYGVGSVFARQRFAGVAPAELSFRQLFAAGVLLLPATAVAPPRGVPDAGAVLALLVLAVICTAVAYLIYFTLITRIGAVGTTSVTFLIPVFGIVWGALFLQEPLSVAQLPGILLIFLSMALVSGLIRKPD